MASHGGPLAWSRFVTCAYSCHINIAKTKNPDIQAVGDPANLRLVAGAMERGRESVGSSQSTEAEAYSLVVLSPSFVLVWKPTHIGTYVYTESYLTMQNLNHAKSKIIRRRSSVPSQVWMLQYLTASCGGEIMELFGRWLNLEEGWVVLGGEWAD